MTDPSATMEGTIAHLRRFVVECAELRELERSLGRFNVFDVLRSAVSELLHSNAVSASGLIGANEAMGLTRTYHF